jgi:NTE family protein
LKDDLEKTLSTHSAKPLDFNGLERDLHRIAGVGRYSRFSYRLRGTDSEPVLVVNAEERGYAPPILNLGVIVDGNDAKNVRFTATGRITALDVGGYRAEWRTDFAVGSIWTLASEYYKPFSQTSRWFAAPHVVLANNPFDLYAQSTRIASYRLAQLGGGLDIGYEISRFSEFRIGYDAGYFSSNLSVGSPVLPTPSGRTGATTLLYDLDKLDSPTIPRTGEALRWRAQWFDAMPGARRGFPLGDIYAAFVRPISRPASVYIQMYGGSTLGHDDTGLPQFFLGGAGRLSAYGLNELRGNQYFLGRMGYLHEVFGLPPLVGNKVFLAGAYEIGKMYGRQAAASRLPMDASIGVIAETFLGPISVGGSVGDRGHQKWFFQIGRLF